MQSKKEKDVFGIVYISSNVMDSIIRLPDHTSTAISDYVIENGVFMPFPTLIFQEKSEEAAARYTTLKSIIFSFEPIYYSKTQDDKIYFDIDRTDGYYLNERIGSMDDDGKIHNLREIKKIVKLLDEREIFGYVYYNQKNGWFDYAEIKKAKNEFGQRMDSVIKSISD